jgi:catechol 2,3-dioxygenase-like lactoylglutathione lyase family enzyme
VNTPFSRVHHICIAVRDIERAVAYYESVGIGPWHDYPPLEEFTRLDVPDPDGFRNLDYRYAWIGEFQLQLVQPGPEPTPQRRFLEEHGEGVFHVGFEVPDADAADADAASRGRAAPY